MAGGQAQGLVKVRPSRAGVRWVAMCTYDVGGALKNEVKATKNALRIFGFRR